jgi:hypothetical protein
VRKLYYRGMAFIHFLMDRLIDFCTFIILDLYRLPWSQAQAAAHRIAWWVGDYAWLVRDLPRMSAYRLTGVRWSLVFVGSERELRYVRDLFFPDEAAHQESLGRISTRSLDRHIHDWLDQGVDLVIGELSRAYPWQLSAPVHIVTPTWVHQMLDINTSPDTLLEHILPDTKKRRSIRQRLNKAERAGFDHYFTTDEADFARFHHQMYRPFITARHGDRAMLGQYADQKRRWFDRGGLIMITQDEQPAAGVLYVETGDTALIAEEGIRDANADLLKNEVNAYLYWQSIHRAAQRGRRRFDIGGSRGWRSSGPFGFKARWGAQVVRPRKVYSEWHLLMSSPSPALRAYVNQIAFMAEVDGKMVGTWIGADLPQRAVEAAHDQGLAGVALFTPHTAPALYLKETPSQAAPQQPRPIEQVATHTAS